MNHTEIGEILITIAGCILMAGLVGFLILMSWLLSYWFGGFVTLLVALFFSGIAFKISGEIKKEKK